MSLLGAKDRLAEEHREKQKAAQDAWIKFQTLQREFQSKSTLSADDQRRLEREYAAYEAIALAANAARERHIRDLERRAGEMSAAGKTLTPGEGGELLRAIKAARLGGDGHAHRDLELKGWIEGTDSAGGYLVPPEVLPGYLAARRASSPLRERCRNYSVNTNEVTLITEGNSITVQHTAEAATKVNSTGTVGQKISTVHKVAGTTYVSDELLADSNGLAADLVSRQFAAQIGIAIDTAIISGTGTGQPTGIRNTAGVNATAVDGQGGAALHNSVLKATSRIAQRFYKVDTVVVHPRDLVKFDLATDTAGRYLFEGGIANRFPNAAVIADANVPATLGGGSNETVMIVGDFDAGAYFFNRQPLTIEASRDAGFVTDETVFRGLERYGFAVVVPGAFEILTGITP